MQIFKQDKVYKTNNALDKFVKLEHHNNLNVGLCETCKYKFSYIFFYAALQCYVCKSLKQKPCLVEFTVINQKYYDSLTDKTQLKLVPIHAIMCVNSFIPVYEDFKYRMEGSKLDGMKISDMLIEILEYNSVESLNVIEYKDNEIMYLYGLDSLQLFCLQLLYCYGKQYISKLFQDAPFLFDLSDYTYIMDSYDVPESLDYTHRIYIRTYDYKGLNKIDLDKEYKEARYYSNLIKDLKMGNVKFDLRIVIEWYDTFMDNIFQHITEGRDLFYAESKNIIHSYQCRNEEQLIAKLKDKYYMQKDYFDKMQEYSDDFMLNMVTYLENSQNYDQFFETKVRQWRNKYYSRDSYLPKTYKVIYNIFDFEFIQKNGKTLKVENLFKL